MTTMAALLGALPLVIATGPGSELRRPLGITIIGGLLVSQVLTLYTTPVIYLLLDRLHRRLGGAELHVHQRGPRHPAGRVNAKTRRTGAAAPMRSISVPPKASDRAPASAPAALFLLLFVLQSSRPCAC